MKKVHLKSAIPIYIAAAVWLIMGLIFHWVGLIPACIVIIAVMPGFLPFIPWIIVWAALLAFIGTCAGLCFDLTKPRMDWLNEIQAIKSGFNQVLSLLAYIGVLGTLTVGSVLLYRFTSIKPILWAVLMAAVLLLLCGLVWLWLRRCMRHYETIGE